MPPRHVCTLTQSITLSPAVLLSLFIKDSGTVQSCLFLQGRGPLRARERPKPQSPARKITAPAPRGEVAETCSRYYMNLIYALDRKLSQLLFLLKHFENKAAEHLKPWEPLKPWALGSSSLAWGETQLLHRGTSLQRRSPLMVLY